MTTLRWIALLCVFGLAGCGRGAPAEPFVSEAGNYRVSIPGKPQVSTQSQGTANVPLTMNVAAFDSPEQVSYTVTYTEFPAQLIQNARLDAMLDKSVQSMLQAGGWTARDSKTIQLDGKHPGRDVVFDVSSPQLQEKVLGHARIYIIGNRLYQILALGPASSIDEARLLAFQESFQLLHEVPSSQGAAPPPTAPTPAPTQPAPASAPAQPVPAPSGPAPDAGRLAFEAARRLMNGDTGEFQAPASPSPAAAVGGQLAASSGGVEIADLAWVDAMSDRIGGGNDPNPNQQPDQHLRLALRLPQGSVLRSIAVWKDDHNQWTTQDDGTHWQVGIFQGDQAITRTHVDPVGPFTGDQVFDLYLDTPGGLPVELPFQVAAVVSVGGVDHTVGASVFGR